MPPPPPPPRPIPFWFLGYQLPVPLYLCLSHANPFAWPPILYICLSPYTSACLMPIPLPDLTLYLTPDLLPLTSSLTTCLTLPDYLRHPLFCPPTRPPPFLPLLSCLLSDPLPGHLTNPLPDPLPGPLSGPLPDLFLTPLFAANLADLISALFLTMHLTDPLPDPPSYPNWDNLSDLFLTLYLVRKVPFWGAEKTTGFSVDIGKMLFRASINPGQKQETLSTPGSGVEYNVPSFNSVASTISSVALTETFRYLELCSTCLTEGLGRSKPSTNP
jgi:hypothetical protein